MLHDSKPAEPRRRVPLYAKILFGLIVGMTLGLIANQLGRVPADSDQAAVLDADGNGVSDRLDWWAANVADTIGKVFLRLVLMVVVPLVVSALSLGVVGLGDLSRLGRLGLRTLAMTALLSTSAVALGLIMTSWIRPGERLAPAQRDALMRHYSGESQANVQQSRQLKPLKNILLDMIPENPLQEMVGAIDGSSKGNGMLAVMVFSLLLGIAITWAPEETKTLVALLEGLYAVSMGIISLAMRLAPLAVGCLGFSIASRLGLQIVFTLGWFVLTVLAGLAAQFFIVYPVVLILIARMSPWFFFTRVSEAIVTAFGTSSSNATLPTSMRVAETRLGLPKEIAHFVLTIGATGNQNGTALYEGVVVLFLAQVFGVTLDLSQQITVVLMSILAGVGTAGVPGGSLPLIVVVLRSVGVPGEGIGIILGVDRLLDMCRTTLNVTGDLAIAACVAAGEEKVPTPSSSPAPRVHDAKTSS